MSRPPLRRAIQARARAYRVDYDKPGWPECAARRFDPAPELRAMVGWRRQRHGAACAYDLDIEAEHLGEQAIVLGDVWPDKERPPISVWMRRDRAEVRTTLPHMGFHGLAEVGGHGQRPHMVDLHHDPTELRRVYDRWQVAHQPVEVTARQRRIAKSYVVYQF